MHALSSSEKGLAAVWVLLVAVVSLALGAGAMWYLQQAQQPAVSPTPTPSTSTPSAPSSSLSIVTPDIGKDPADTAEQFLAANTIRWPASFYMLSQRARQCIDPAINDEDSGTTAEMSQAWSNCGVESSNGMGDEIPDPSFTVTNKTATQATVDVTSGGQKYYTYTLVLENGWWYVDKVEFLLL